MAKKITQNTFDDVVKENMEEFDLSREDAIKDAIEQFTSQGVDLSTVITDSQSGGDGNTKHAVIEALEFLEANYEQADLSEHLNIVTRECNVDIARRCLAGKRAYEVLLSISGLENDNLHLSIIALCALCNGQPDLLTNTGIVNFLNLIAKSESKQVALVVKLIRLTCIKHEGNRQNYVTFYTIPKLMELLRRCHDDVGIVTEVCSLLRVLTYDDDVRVPFGQGHEHAKEIVAQNNALKTILDISQEYSDNASVVGELYSTLGKLSVRNEFCQEILDLGGVEMILKSFQTSMHHQTIVKQILPVLKALAGNDKVKVNLASDGGLYLILTAMQKHVKQALICELSCAALSALVLRQPKSCQLAFEAGAAQAVVQAMQIHPDHPGLQKQACMAVRNLVARTREHISIFMELGVEPLLNLTLAKHKCCHDEAKAALRDLECKVELRELWKGEKGQLQY